MSINLSLFTFRAKLAGVWDGDTIYLDIDRGERIWTLRQKYRLYGVDTPEIRGASDEEEHYGHVAKKFVNDLLKDKELIVSTHRGKSKYDWMVEVFVRNDRKELESLTSILIDRGYGVPYYGGTKLSWEERKAIQDKAMLSYPTPDPSLDLLDG